MTDRSPPILSRIASEPTVLTFSNVPAPKDEIIPHNVKIIEEEPYTIKCICDFFKDDGNTIYCETCDTWQHIDCFYPDNREEAIREDFAHSCAECKPRPLDLQKAVERTLRLKNTVVEKQSVDRKPKRPPSKSHKKKVKPIDTNGHHGPPDTAKHGSPNEQAAVKRPKSAHRPSHSVSSQTSKRSPSYGNARSNQAQPPSPATTPPDLPQNFLIHHYSDNFRSLYDEQDVEIQSNVFAKIAIPQALGRWLQDPGTMKREVGRTHSDVFQEAPPGLMEKRPLLEVRDLTRSSDAGSTLRWRSVKCKKALAKDAPLIELNGVIGFQKDYCSDPGNLWVDLSSPLPFVFFHPVLPLYIDTRKEGSLARYVRRSCKPNAQLDTYLWDGSNYQFWLVSDRYISANEQITLPWDFRLEKSVHARWLHLLGLSDDESASQPEPPLDESEYQAIANWIDRILSEYGGCACDLENNCAFARFHRHYLFGKSQSRASKKKQQPPHRKGQNHTISPTSTGHATNSRAASEAFVDENIEVDNKNEAGPVNGRLKIRDPTPVHQGQFDQLGILTEPTNRDKRKVAMVEDSFRRMEQQQQLLRKKKRASEENAPSTLSKSKTSGGPVPLSSAHIESDNAKSTSGSPVSLTSPKFRGHAQSGALMSLNAPFAPSSSRVAPCPRPAYADAAVQTEALQGEWYSSASAATKRRRVIPLCKRLLNSRMRNMPMEEYRRRSQGHGPLSAAASSVDGSLEDQQSHYTVHSNPNPQSPVLKNGDDTPLHDAPNASSAVHVTTPQQVKARAPDLRVMVPPVPPFERARLPATPLSASSNLARSPFSAGIVVPPFAPSVANGIASHPSPVKKKLSLSDYTKSRMNKAMTKGSLTPTCLKTAFIQTDDAKADISPDV